MNSVPPDEIAFPVPVRAIPIVAVATALIGAVLIRETWAIPAYAAFGGILGAICVVDLRELRIPNQMVGAAAAVTFPLLLLATLADRAEWSFTRAVLGALAAFGIYLVLNLISPASLGMGDVKLSFVIGAHLGFIGWQPWFWAIFFAFCAMAVVGLAMMAALRARVKTALPFGPFMVVGALISIGIWA